MDSISSAVAACTRACNGHRLVLCKNMYKRVPVDVNI